MDIYTFIHSLNHLFNNHILNVYYEPGTVPEDNSLPKNLNKSSNTKEFKFMFKDLQSQQAATGQVPSPIKVWVTIPPLQGYCTAKTRY